MRKNNSRCNVQSILLNFGPQHPAAHGILKISLKLSGETIVRADPQFGLLHRGSEKLMENKSYLQSIPYLDRMDYVANLFQEHAFILSVESLSNYNVKANISIIRIIFDELSRILNHLLTISAICLDMGAMGPIFWAFEEREQIMEVYERISGARMHTALYRPMGNFEGWFYKNLYNDIVFLINRGSRFICGSFLSLLNNRALKTRLSGVGKFTKNKIKAYGISGVIARSSGLAKDIRVENCDITYSKSYKSISLNSFIATNGDSMDRFIIRSKEVLESFRVISQCINLKPFINANSSKKKFTVMEDVISHFKSNSLFSINGKGLSIEPVEGPKGIVAVTIVNNSNFYPYRVQVRSPVARNMNLISTIGDGLTFADFVATFCSLDVVLGEIDR